MGIGTWVQSSAHTTKFFKFHMRSEVTFEIYEEFYENIVRKFVQNCKAIGVGEVPNPHWGSIGTMDLNPLIFRGGVYLAVGDM